MRKQFSSLSSGSHLVYFIFWMIRAEGLRSLVFVFRSWGQRPTFAENSAFILRMKRRHAKKTLLVACHTQGRDDEHSCWWSCGQPTSSSWLTGQFFTLCSAAPSSPHTMPKHKEKLSKSKAMYTFLLKGDPRGHFWVVGHGCGWCLFFSLGLPVFFRFSIPTLQHVFFST